MTNAQQASNRLRSLYGHGVHNRATDELEHNLETWENLTGKTLGGKYGMSAPRGTTAEEKFALDAIIENFLSDNTSTLQGIKESFKNVPSGMKKSGKKYSVGEQARALDIAERMQKEQAIKQAIGSNQYRFMWSVAKEQGFSTADMIDAMYSVATGDISVSVEQLVLGEGLAYGGDYSFFDENSFEDATIDYLLNVMEVRR